MTLAVETERASSRPLVTRTEDTRDLWRLEDAWRALQQADPNATVFSTWEWNSTVARHFAREARLRVLLLESNGRPEALIPLVERRKLGLRTLVLLGTSLTDYSRADYQDFLIAPGRTEDALQACIEDLRRGPAWDMVWLQEVPAESPVARELPVLARRRGWHVEVLPGSDVYRVPLPRTWDEYSAGISTNTRAAIGRKTRKLERDHNGRFERLPYGDDPSAMMETLFDLHTRRWNHDGRPGIFCTEASCTFHRDLAHGLAEADMLDLTLLRACDETIGARYSFLFQGTRSFYASGFDPGPEWSAFSPGLLMDAGAIRDGIARRLECEDLLRGEGTYKQRYAPIGGENVDLRIYRTGRAYRYALALRALKNVARAVPGLRRAKHRLGALLRAKGR